MLPKPLPTKLPRRMLEVERKFAPTPTSIHLLTHNAGRPQFAHLEQRPACHFEDTYYDDAKATLFKQGIWVRQRRHFPSSIAAAPYSRIITKWEAKVRVGGDFTRSAFEEVEGVGAVAEVVRQHVPDARVGITDEDSTVEGVGEIARFKTLRRRWLAERRFEVVLDEASFGHVVGEVELMEEVPVNHGDGQGDGRTRQALITRLDGDIERFMDKYIWAFPKGVVQGKLSAFFERTKKDLSDETTYGKV